MKSSIVFKKDEPGIWYNKTLEMLKNRPAWLTFRMIADATGLEEAWLKSFATGRSPNASVNRVETLNRYLLNLKP